MSDDPRISELLLRWREARRAGTAPSTLEELCSDCPELIGEIVQRLAETRVGLDRIDTAVPVKAGETKHRISAGDQLGGFRLVRELGRGGMGIVFEGEDMTLGRRVALKILLPELTDEPSRKRFLREARAVAALKHDYIVGVYQVSQQDDAPYLVMEYLEGETLDNRLDREGWLTVHEALRIARQIAEGLAAAHSKGLIHRDVKPANVWLEQPNDRVKLLDFGLAKPISSDTAVTVAGAIVGTPGYMAPEQIYGDTLDGRTDIYALGCLLFRMLSGKTPHQDPDTMNLLQAVVDQDAPDLAGANIPPAVRQLLKQMLERNPNKRPHNAEAVAERLHDLERDLVIPHLPRPTTKKAALLGSRLNAGVWIGTLVIGLAALVGAIALYIRMTGGTNSGSDDKGDDAVAAAKGEPIRVGVLHSLRGTYAASEQTMVEAIDLAVKEINDAGGVKGRQIELFVADGNSDEHEFARMAEKLITEDKVSVIFGCWSSAARKQVAAVCEKHHNLLIYSCVYEGLEQSPNVIYAGGAPNQQLQPSAKWAYSQWDKRRFFLVGSDAVFSRAMNQILRDEVQKLGGTVVGEEYVALDGVEFAPIVAKIKQTKADVIFNMLDGTNSNFAFFHELRRSGVRAADVPTCWLGIGEEEMSTLPIKESIGDFSANPYFQSIESPANEQFLKRFRQRNKARVHVSDSTEASYCAVNLWKLAVEKAGSAAPTKVYEAARGQTYDGPEGRVRIDPNNLHAWRTVRVARMTDQLHFEVVFTTPKPVQPEPFPPTRTKEQWEKYLKSLYDGWGGRWEGPRISPPK